jgi:hypothetical protein
MFSCLGYKQNQQPSGEIIFGLRIEEFSVVELNKKLNRA